MMASSTETVLFHYTPPDGTGGPGAYYTYDGINIQSTTFHSILTSDATFATHNPQPLIERAAAEGYSRLPKLVDVSMAVRLLAGQPAKDFKPAPPPWDLGNCLNTRLSDRHGSKSVWQVMNGLPLPRGIQIDALAYDAVVELHELWRSALRSMEHAGERVRFDRIEAPVALLLYAATLRGVRIDTPKWDEAYRASKDRYYALLRRVKTERKVDFEVLRRNPRILLQELEREGSTDATAWPDSATSDEIVDFLKSGSPLSADLHEIWKLESDNRILLGIRPLLGDRTRPKFDPVGTVTSRSIARDPFIQNLSKRLRYLIIPTEGYRFAYVDYSFFEPMIMVALSRSQQLDSVCQEGDLYEYIAAQCGYPGRRAEFKRLFLGYSYGMGERALRRWAGMELNVPAPDAERVVASMRSILADLSAWKDVVCSQVEADGSASSLLGNHRRRQRQGPLDEAERRWAVNQLVQGTASLILKHALLAVNDRFGDRAQLILPMHDAALYEIPDGSNNAEIERGLVEEFVAAAQRIIPTARARATVQPFASVL